MSEKPKSRAELEQRIALLEASDKDRREVNDNIRRELNAAVTREKETRAQFADLKERLVISEANNQRMRGYISRVQEDDTVREELIAVGDPAGEQQLVPKRKPATFSEPYPYRMDSSLIAPGSVARYRDHEQTKPLKHWVTY